MGRRHHLASFADNNSAEQILAESQLARKSSTLLEDSVSDMYQEVVGLPYFEDLQKKKIPISPSKRYTVVAGQSSFSSTKKEEVKVTRGVSLMQSVEKIRRGEKDVKGWVELGMKMIDKVRKRSKTEC